MDLFTSCEKKVVKWIFEPSICAWQLLSIERCFLTLCKVWALAHGWTVGTRTKDINRMFYSSIPFRKSSNFLGWNASNAWNHERDRCHDGSAISKAEAFTFQGSFACPFAAMADHCRTALRDIQALGLEPPRNLDRLGLTYLVERKVPEKQGETQKPVVNGGRVNNSSTVAVQPAPK